MEKLPKDGHYFCQLDCPNRGSVGTAVKIHKGKVTDYLRTPQDPTLLSKFRKMSIVSYVYYFRRDAVKELRKLRRRIAQQEREINKLYIA